MPIQRQFKNILRKYKNPNTATTQINQFVGKDKAEINETKKKERKIRN